MNGRMKNAQMRSPSLRKKNSTTSSSRAPVMTSAAADTPATALRPNSALVRKSMIESRASSTCCGSIGIGSVSTQSSRSSKPSVADWASDAHWLRTANTIAVMMPPSTMMPPSRVTHAARMGGMYRRSHPTSGLAAAARMSAMSTGITSSLTCTSAHTASAPSASTSMTCRLRIAQRPSRSFQIGPPVLGRSVSSPGTARPNAARPTSARRLDVRVGRPCDDPRAPPAASADASRGAPEISSRRPARRRGARAAARAAEPTRSRSPPSRRR